MTSEPVRLPRVLLADDHVLVAEGIGLLLESHFEFLGTVENGRELLRAAAELRPDVVLLDISMPILNGLEAARQLKDALPSVRIVFLTMHADTTYLREALNAGAQGYVLKRAAASELVQAIKTVMNGSIYITPSLGNPADGDGNSRGEALTPRQREVLQLVAEGYSAKEIGGLLGISVKTAEFHKAGIMQKLRIRTVAELTKYAMEHGITGDFRK